MRPELQHVGVGSIKTTKRNELEDQPDCRPDEQAASPYDGSPYQRQNQPWGARVSQGGSDTPAISLQN